MIGRERPMAIATVAPGTPVVRQSAQGVARGWPDVWIDENTQVLANGSLVMLSMLKPGTFVVALDQAAGLPRRSEPYRRRAGCGGGDVPVGHAGHGVRRREPVGDPRAHLSRDGASRARARAASAVTEGRGH